MGHFGEFDATHLQLPLFVCVPAALLSTRSALLSAAVKAYGENGSLRNAALAAPSRAELSSVLCLSADATREDLEQAAQVASAALVALQGVAIECCTCAPGAVEAARQWRPLRWALTPLVHAAGCSKRGRGCKLGAHVPGKTELWQQAST